MSSGKQRWRFSFQITEGVNAGLGAGPWRLWVHKDEIYLAAAKLANTIKVSLHSSGKWRVAYTAEHVSSDESVWKEAAGRAPWKFAGPPSIEGVQEAFVVAATRSALRPVESSNRDAVVPLEDRWDRIGGVQLIVTDSHIRVAPAESLVFEEPLQLASGRLVWLQTFQEVVQAVDPEPVPVNQLIRVLTPESDGVTRPGLLVIAVNVA